jgi:signal transduction histidine kinase
MEEYMQQFELGMNVSDQWTNYPKGKATTCHMNVSGLKFAEDGDKMHFCVMCEGIPLVKEELIQANTRGVEMLRHLPVAVAQFDMEGKVMYQNPEATISQKVPLVRKEKSNSKIGEELKEMDNSFHSLTASHRSECSASSERISNPTKTTNGDFLQRFGDPEIGGQVLEEIQLPTHDRMDFEASINTRTGPRWCAVQLRKGKDPVTGETVILYSASDKTDAIRAMEERKAREQKSEFLAIMAHEIRTPLHQVTGFIDLLDQTTLNAEQKSFVRLLKASAQGLMTVISDVLDYSKLEAGKMKIESIPYEPLSVMEGSLAAVRTSCEDKGLCLDLSWSKDVPFKLMGDPNRLRQILLNLLSNAIKFTEEGGITVKATASLSYPANHKSSKRPLVRFEVTDTGVGVSEENQRAIFRKYQQADASVSRNFGGTGLGLSICKLLVKHMKGSIGVESQLGQGATFWVSLPVEVPTEESLQEQMEDESTNEIESLHILVAEDNKVNQKLLSSMLTRMGHTLDLASNGKEAVELTEGGDYDVVLME